MKSKPATVVYTWQVKQSQHEAMHNWLHDIAQDAVKFRGHLGVTTVHQAGSNTYTGVLRFNNQKNLETWLDSDVRKRWLKKLDGIATESKTRLTGLETWFELPGTNPPPRWKMAFATFLGVYPIVLVLGWFVLPHITRINFFIRELLIPIVAPILLTFLIMPFITQKVLRRWLYK